MGTKKINITEFKSLIKKIIKEEINLDKNEIMEIALHLYMRRENIPYRGSQLSIEELYNNKYIDIAKKEIPTIENLIIKKELTKEDIYDLVNGKYGSFDRTIRILTK